MPTSPRPPRRLSKKRLQQKRASIRAPTAATKRKHAASVLRGIHSVLRAHGISGRITHMRMKVTARAGQCPDGQVWRMVCEPDENGTTQCDFKCVPA
jgi:hypothetical protein